MNIDDRDLKEEVSVHLLMINLEMLRDYISDILFKWDITHRKFGSADIIITHSQIKKLITDTELRLEQVAESLIKELTPEEITTIMEEAHEKSDN